MIRAWLSGSPNVPVPGSSPAFAPGTSKGTRGCLPGSQFNEAPANFHAAVRRSRPSFYQKLYPILWEANTLYRGSITVRSDVNEGKENTAEGTNPVKQIELVFDTPTNELSQTHFTTVGAAPNNMSLAASPRLLATTGGVPQEYVGFFYSHNATLADVPDANRFRMFARFVNDPTQLNGNGADPFAVMSIKVEKVVAPEAAPVTAPTPAPTPDTIGPGTDDPELPEVPSDKRATLYASLESGQVRTASNLSAPPFGVTGFGVFKLDLKGGRLLYNIKFTGLESWRDVAGSAPQNVALRIMGSAPRETNPATPVTFFNISLSVPAEMRGIVGPLSYGGTDADAVLAFEHDLLDGNLYAVVTFTSTAHPGPAATQLMRGQIEVDFDDDGVSNYVEVAKGMNPFDRDSDNDNLIVSGTGTELPN